MPQHRHFFHTDQQENALSNTHVQHTRTEISRETTRDKLAESSLSMRATQLAHHIKKKKNLLDCQLQCLPQRYHVHQNEGMLVCHSCSVRAKEVSTGAKEDSSLNSHFLDIPYQSHADQGREKPAEFLIFTHRAQKSRADSKNNFDCFHCIVRLDCKYNKNHRWTKKKHMLDSCHYTTNMMWTSGQKLDCFTFSVLRVSPSKTRPPMRITREMLARFSFSTRRNRNPLWTNKREKACMMFILCRNDTTSHANWWDKGRLDQNSSGKMGKKKLA